LRPVGVVCTFDLPLGHGCVNLIWPRVDGDTAKMVLFDPGKVPVTRYRYRGNIPSPWPTLSAPD